VEVDFETGTVSSCVKARRRKEVIFDMGEIYCDVIQNWTRIGLTDRIQLLRRIRQNGIWKVPERDE
jgi:hypothetical protein